MLLRVYLGFCLVEFLGSSAYILPENFFETKASFAKALVDHLKIVPAVSLSSDDVDQAKELTYGAIPATKYAPSDSETQKNTRHEMKIPVRQLLPPEYSKIKYVSLTPSLPKEEKIIIFKNVPLAHVFVPVSKNEDSVIPRETQYRSTASYYHSIPSTDTYDSYYQPAMPHYPSVNVPASYEATYLSNLSNYHRIEPIISYEVLPEYHHGRHYVTYEA
ncbi:hypothetical protein BIW11_05596 [Tropilaelaps mercedesae]|uniref:Uncharacterized protein n=1 Tax=Tropilaelaps mercedesae TaxID=418985 RepID=A0A1V9Y1M9_9ACAR|nr:hypothetical protein BIW11_05596 [Tropilaelaps mercedesae]